MRALLSTMHHAVTLVESFAVVPVFCGLAVRVGIESCRGELQLVLRLGNKPVSGFRPSNVHVRFPLASVAALADALDAAAAYVELQTAQPAGPDGPPREY